MATAKRPPKRPLSAGSKAHPPPKFDPNKPITRELNDVPHNVLITASLSIELKRLHHEHQRAIGEAMAYAEFFRDVVLPQGMTALTARYPIR